MTEQYRRDPFAALFPANIARMPTAWHHLHIPGAPAAFRLRTDEIDGAPEQRFRRRTVLAWNSAEDGGDRLALVDKALPHARFDLMLSEVSASPRPTASAVLPGTARALWRAALEFARFVSLPGPRQEFQLEGGRLVLALNCDPHTRDRESVQAAKQFHLHLLYWSAQELEALATPMPLGAITDPRERRQGLDPLSFLGGSLIAAALGDLDLRAVGGRLVGMDSQAVIRGERAPGCLIELPAWSVLGESSFEVLLRAIHRRLERLSARVCLALVGHAEPPARWRRHPLRPPHERHAALQALDLPEPVATGLATLASALRDLSPATATRLQRATPATRMHCMSLNQPCYGINLYAPETKGSQAPAMASAPLHLLLSAKLFSGTGCAGLLPLAGVPSVRVQRGRGEFGARDWSTRAAWQRAFGEHLRHALADRAGPRIEPVRRLRDFARGWR